MKHFEGNKYFVLFSLKEPLDGSVNSSDGGLFS